MMWKMATGREGVGWTGFQALVTVTGFRCPRLRLVRRGDGPVSVKGHIIGVYLVAFEVKEQVIYKLLLVPAPRVKH